MDRYKQIKQELRSGNPVDPTTVRMLATHPGLSKKQQRRCQKIEISALASNNQPLSAILYGPFYSTRWPIADQDV